jgi:hypothetical protein
MINNLKFIENGLGLEVIIPAKQKNFYGIDVFLNKTDPEISPTLEIIEIKSKRTSRKTQINLMEIRGNHKIFHLYGLPVFKFQKFFKGKTYNLGLNKYTDKTENPKIVYSVSFNSVNTNNYNKYSSAYSSTLSRNNSSNQFFTSREQIVSGIDPVEEQQAQERIATIPSIRRRTRGSNTSRANLILGLDLDTLNYLFASNEDVALNSILRDSLASRLSRIYGMTNTRVTTKIENVDLLKRVLTDPNSAQYRYSREELNHLLTLETNYIENELNIGIGEEIANGLIRSVMRYDDYSRVFSRQVADFLSVQLALNGI